MILKNKKVGGFAAITLVLWTTIGLTGLLYSLVESYQYELINIATSRQMASARSSALFCRDVVLREFLADASFLPQIGEYVSIFDKGRCTVTAFSSTALRDGVGYIEQKELVIRGESIGAGRGGTVGIGSGSLFDTTSVRMKTRFDISNDLVQPFKLLYTVEI